MNRKLVARPRALTRCNTMRRNKTILRASLAPVGGVAAATLLVLFAVPILYLFLKGDQAVKPI